MATKSRAPQKPDRKPGRPKSENPLREAKRINIMLPDAVFADATVLARARGESVNAYMRGLVVADIERHAGLIKKQRAITLDAKK